jgi:hypothetical protein
MQDPDDPGSIFRIYLDQAVNALLAAGIAVTNDTSQIVARTCGAGGIPPEVIPVAAQRFLAQPNPFTSSTTITFTPGSSRDVGVLIYDISGRLLRTVQRSMSTDDQDQFFWNGRDETGRIVPPGTYYYRLDATSGPAAGRVTRLP